MRLATKISMVAVLPLSASVIVPLTTTIPNVKTSEAHLLDFNDFHGAAPGYGDKVYASGLSMPSAQDPGVIRLAKVIYDFQKQHPNSVLLSAGDNNSGNAFSTSNHAEYFFPLLKAMGCRCSAVGNHAFEWGLSYMSDKKFDEWARPDDLPIEENYFVTSNILNGSEYQGKDTNYETWREKKVSWADPYKLLDINGHNICLIGLTTKLTKTDGNEAAIKDLSFINYNASVSYTKRYIYETLGEETFNKIDAFVLLTHVASSFDNGVYSDEAFDLARDELTTDVDAIISAHSHKEGVAKVWNKNLGKYIWVGQANTAGRALLDTKLEFDDTRAVGHRLKSVSMQLLHPTIDTAGIDMTRKDLTEDEKTKARDAAISQYEKLVSYAKSLSTTEMLRQLVDEYESQRTKVINNLGTIICDTEIETNLDYNVMTACHMGHEFYSSKYLNEPMGAWACKAALIGTDILRATNHPDAPTPCISFINQDSITHEILKSRETPKISLYDIYQLQTYENPIYQGVITVGQLANIIDYMLSGGLISQNEPYSKDEKSAFTYGVDNLEYDKVDSVEKDPITGDTITLPTLKDTKGRSTKLRYLCGPLQFYGFKFEIEAIEPERTYDRKNIRQYKLAWDADTNLPKIWIYDPSAASSHAGIDDYNAWKQVGNGWDIDKYIPVVINSFTYGGGNFQATMFKAYMEYNAAQHPTDKSMQVYKYQAQFTRDALIEYCKNYQSESPSYKLTLLDGAIKELIVYPS